MFPEDQTSQFGESNLKQGEDVVVYVKLSIFRPEAVRNLSASGKSVADIVATDRGVYIVCAESDASDIVKTLITDSLQAK
jgi:hypothetical protein